MQARVRVIGVQVQTGCADCPDTVYATLELTIDDEPWAHVQRRVVLLPQTSERVLDLLAEIEREMGWASTT